MTGQSDEAGLQLEHVMASDLYPKKPMTSDDKSLQVPYPTLPGESVLYLGKTSDGIVALSNFRLFIRFKDSFINLPLGLVDGVECREIFYLYLFCKDSRTFRCTFPTNDSCIEWFKRIINVMMPASKLDEHFAFVFHAWCRDSVPRDIDIDFSQELMQSDKYSRYLFDREVERMGFQLGSAWKITHVNEHYEFSPTYPPYHLVPASFRDIDLQNVANFRAAKRFPSVVWRSQSNGGVIARCSQPEVGWLGWRNEFDEAMIQAIAKSAICNTAVSSSDYMAKLEALGDGEGNSTSQAGKMLIVDCRSYAAAWANRAKGGGCECAEYYENCEVVFMGLANIHAVRKSFQAVRALCAGTAVDQASWFSALETTKWLHHISAVLRASLVVVNALDCESRPVLVHCSDGWDRTPQIVSLAKLMLDPYYRTLQGFQVLVEREWLEFGHKFADRCGNGVCSDDLNERSPVFLQWLDCVHQLVKQFPCAFEFNEAFLVKLVQHAYSCLFGTFLCNSSMERHAQKVRERTRSVWLLLKSGRFHNFLFSTAGPQVMRPSCQLRHLSFWSSVYLNSTAPTAASLDELRDVSGSLNLKDDPALTQSELKKKTKSCDDIMAAIEHGGNMTRRLSDPNISMDTHHDSSLKQQVVHAAEDSAACDDRITVNIPDFVSFVNSVSETTLANGTKTDVIEMKEILEKNKRTSVEAVNCDTENVTRGVITNGHHSEEEVELDNGLNVKYSRNVATATVMALTGLTESHLSSTDTLTEDLALLEQRNTGLQVTVNGQHTEDSDGVCKGRRLADHNKAITVSTSTSDISDSHVKINSKRLKPNGHSKLDEALLNLNVMSGLRTFTNGRSQGHSDLQLHNPSSKVSMSSTDTGNSTPSYYRSPSSTCPPTPGTNNRSLDLGLSRGTNGLGKHMDWDGLTTFSDPAQVRLLQMDREYRSRIESLERQLQAAKLALYQYASGCNGADKHLADNRVDVISLPDEDTEKQSLGNGSTAASDLSWEQLEEKDANMTLWVPDHVVTHCAGCNCEFWLVRRRHHCRSCGKVFCGECTKFSLPVPQQQLHDPVRVCQQCFNNFTSDDHQVELLVIEETADPSLSVEVL